MAGVVENITEYDPSSKLPLKLQGKVVHGYGRGSRQLGFPTANLDPNSFKDLLIDADEGVYFGFAKINDEPIEEMVMSIGWNPQYGNKEKSVEIHILKQYDRDFYNQHLRIISTGWIRPMRKFSGLDELIEAIKTDIKTAQNQLQEPYHAKFRDDSFLTDDVQL
eukprot:TRINITY_DN8098_c0_g1_i1.p1 TRINITY_DN8098_c0_g1~~TRINITY_DN8098_c0_g1_i1.p1  ORF type:complete len:164 (-),score=18.04 TRINITY_DN8098_c0_g1_i1:61-552(-)